MTQRNRECKVQVQASRVSARIAALTVVALALALTRRSATPSDNEGRSAPATSDNQPRGGQRESEGMNANKANSSGKQTVILQAQDFRLTEVLKHLEAGRIVLVILTPDTKAKPKRDTS
jgi:hypothetical protein